MITFDSKQYGWKDITISFGGRIIEGVTEVKYTAKRKKGYLKGRGNKPHDILRGDYEFDGSIELWQSTVESMVKTAKDNDILDISFDIIIAYVPKEGGQTVIDILKGVELTEVGKGMKQGDLNMVIGLPIMFLEVKNQQ